MARALGFYGDVLGLQRLKTTMEDWVEFAIGDQTIGLVKPEAFGTPFQANTAGALGLKVDDVEATIKALEAKGLKVHLEDTGVCHMGFFKDTEGNSLFVHNRYAPDL